MSKAKTEQKFVQLGAYQLPSWLFCDESSSDVSDVFISPSARFDPISALANNPWQNSIKPSAAAKPKTIILTISIYRQHHTPTQWLALIHWLEQRGFGIYLCFQKDKEIAVSFCSAETARNDQTIAYKLNRLTSFNADEDYETLASLFRLTQDEIVVLDSSNIASFFEALTHSLIYINEKELIEVNSFMAIRPTSSQFTRNNLIFKTGMLPQQNQFILQVCCYPFCFVQVDPYQQNQIITPTTNPNVLTNELFNYGGECSAELLMADESKIVNARLLTRCIQQFPKQAKRLIQEHGHLLVNFSEVMDCFKVLATIKDKKEFLSTRNLHGYDPYELLCLACQYEPRLTYWLSDLIRPNTRKIYIDSHQARFFFNSSEYYDWGIHHFGKMEYSLRFPLGERRLMYLLAGLRSKYHYSDKPFIIYASEARKEDEFPLQDISYLFLTASNNLDYLKEQIEQDKMPQLVVVELCLYQNHWMELQSFLKALNKHCPHLQLLLLPDELKGIELGLEMNCPINYQSFVPFTSRSNQGLADYPNHLIAPNKLYLANGELNSVVTDKTKVNAFTMVKAGEVLNYTNQILPRLRTGLVELSEDLTSQHYYQAKLQDISRPKTITESELNLYRNASTEQCYCYFTVQLSAGKTVRLPSVDTQDVLLGIAAEDNNLSFFRGDDDFFYVKASQTCQLSYLIKADSVETQRKRLQEIPRSDPLMYYVNAYLEQKEEGEEAIPMLQGDRDSWLDKLYQHRAGACRLRCYAVWHAVRKNDALRDCIRIVDIDKNHMRIEIYLYGRWQQVDLGGISGQLNYAGESVYKPSSLEAKKEAKKLPNPQTSKSFLLDNWLHKQHKLESIQSIQDLDRKLFHDASSTTLIVSEDLETQAMLILAQAKGTQIRIFYLDKPSSYGFSKAGIKIDANGNPFITKKDDLDLFLEGLSGTSSAIIMVNWDGFSSQQCVAMNTLIDRNKTLYGKELPPCIRVISLCSKYPQDRSFASRHLKRFCLNLPHEPVFSRAITSEKIDVRGYSNWQSYLFGPIDLVNNQPVWQKGPLTHFLIARKEQLESIALEITNLPPAAEQAFASLVRQAKVEGFFRYLGYRIPFCQAIEIQHNAAPFSFEHFDAITFCPEVQADRLPENCQLINNSLFDYLLTNKEISNKIYRKTDGLIKRHQGKELSLFISTPLAINLWYCLCAETKQYEVKLTLYLAPGVSLPNNLAAAQFSLSAEKSNFFSNPIYISSKAALLANHLAKEQDALCFAVEDYNYYDLVSRIDYQYDEQLGFYDFEEKTSELLQQGKPVILYGQFNQQLLEALAPLILKSWPSQLTLVIEDEQLNGEFYPLLNWLPRNAYQFSQEVKTNPKQSNLIYQEKKVDFCTELMNISQLGEDGCFNEESNSKSEAASFIETRLKKFGFLLAKHPLLQLSGEKAVGKTFLIAEFKQKWSEHIAFYHELNQFKAWASDSSKKPKILFIDDAHHENQNFTLFAPFQESQSPTLLYQGELYPLDDLHRVVFIRSEGNKQKLFADYEIPTFHLSDLPIVFIYERMLKPIYRPNQRLTEEGFNLGIQRYLKCYCQQKDIDPLSDTVCSLQERVLAYWAKETGNIKLRFFPKPDVALNPYFIPIPSTKILRTAFKDFLRIHENSPPQLGMHGFYLKGSPGMGKSELIGDGLAREGYQAIASLDELKDKLRCYIKIDASQPLSAKKTLLVRAFEQGLPVWLDEGNSCMDEGLEKYIKSLLRGIHPDSGQMHDKPGFRLIITANSAAMAGRTELTPALSACFNQNTMPKLTELDLEIIVQKSLDPLLLETTDTAQMAAELYQEFESNPKQTLREIKPKLAEIAKLYQREKPIQCETVGLIYVSSG